jgi:hypothetical protein
MARDRIIVFCPRCSEELELVLEWNVLMIQKNPGRATFITAETTASGVNHTCEK